MGQEANTPHSDSLQKWFDGRGWGSGSTGSQVLYKRFLVSVLYLKNSWIFEESHDKLQLVNVLYLRNSMIALKNSMAGITLLLKNDQVLGKAGWLYNQFRNVLAAGRYFVFCLQGFACVGIYVCFCNYLQLIV